MVRHSSWARIRTIPGQKGLADVSTLSQTLAQVSSERSRNFRLKFLNGAYHHAIVTAVYNITARCIKPVTMALTVTMASLLSPSAHGRSASTYERVKEVYEVKVNEITRT